MANYRLIMIKRLWFKLQNRWHRENLLKYAWKGFPDRKPSWRPYFFGWRDLRNRLKLRKMRPEILKQPRHFVFGRDGVPVNEMSNFPRYPEDFWKRYEAGVKSTETTEQALDRLKKESGCIE